MRSFILNFHGRPSMKVTGESIADACENAGLTNDILRALSYYEEDGKRIQVWNNASCKCNVSGCCDHDLEKVGLYPNSMARIIALKVELRQIKVNFFHVASEIMADEHPIETAVVKKMRDKVFPGMTPPAAKIEPDTLHA